MKGREKGTGEEGTGGGAREEMGEGTGDGTGERTGERTGGGPKRSAERKAERKYGEAKRTEHSWRGGEKAKVENGEGGGWRDGRREGGRRKVVNRCVRRGSDTG